MQRLAKRYSRENREAICDVHGTYCYALDPRLSRQRERVPLLKLQANVYKSTQNDPAGRLRGIPMTGQCMRPNHYEVTTPAGIVLAAEGPGCWSRSNRVHVVLDVDAGFLVRYCNHSEHQPVSDEYEGFGP